MPFTIKKNDKGKFCVHKKNEDGELVGGSLGCHKVKKDAVAQIGAIESKLESSGKKSSDVNFISVPSDLTKLGDLDLGVVSTTGVSSESDIWISYPSREESFSLLEVLTNTAEAKAHSLDGYRSLVSEAWYSLNNRDFYISEIFDEFIIVYNYEQKIYFQIAYSEKDDEVEFVKQNEWIEVKLKKEWVEKFLNLETRLNFSEYILGEDEEPAPAVIENGYAIKSLGSNRIGGYAILWGDEDSKDLDEEFFTPDTADLTAVFDEIGTIPFMVHHAAADEIVKFVSGAVDVLEPDDIGLWWEAKVKEFEAYKKYVSPLMEKGMAYTSSGTFPRAKRTEKNGFISRWPIAEISATWLPAEYRMLEHPISEVKSAYEKLGIEVDLSGYDDWEDLSEIETTKQGVEKARLKELVEQEFIKLGLLQIEFGD